MTEETNSLKRYLNERLITVDESQRVDEFLFATIAAWAFVSYMLYPSAEVIAGKVGGLFSNIGHMLHLDDESRRRREERREEQEKKRKEKEREKELKQKEKELDQRENELNQAGDNTEGFQQTLADREEADEIPMKELAAAQKVTQQQGLFASIIGLVKQSNEKEKDKEKKEKTKEALTIIQGASVDKEGNPVAPEKMGERMKELTGQTPEQIAKAYSVNPLTKKQADELEQQVGKQLQGMSTEERERLAEKEIEAAKQTSKEMQSHKDQMDKLNKDLEDAKREGDKDKISRAQAAIEDQNKKSSGIASIFSRLAQKIKGKKDEEGPDGEPTGTTAKEEVVKDPKTGEKKKQKVYTGPRGGRYYYPEKSPHKPENKVYVESLSEYLTRKI